MSIDLRLNLQKAIFARLTGNSALMTAVGSRIHDFVPQDAAFPHIMMSDYDFTDWGSHTFDGFGGTVRIHTWSRARGRAECRAVQHLIYDLLHKWNPNITGFSTVVFRFSSSNIIVEDDSVTYHGIDEFQIILGGI
jgi:hypothetical protein